MQKFKTVASLELFIYFKKKRKKIRYATTEIEHGPTDLESDILTTLPSHRETINNAGSIWSCILNVTMWHTQKKQERSWKLDVAPSRPNKPRGSRPSYFAALDDIVLDTHNGTIHQPPPPPKLGLIELIVSAMKGNNINESNELFLFLLNIFIGIRTNYLLIGAH